MPFNAIINAFNNGTNMDRAGQATQMAWEQQGLQKQAAAQGQNLFDYHVNNYRPLEQQAIQMASDAGSPAQQEVQAGMAGAQVQKSFTNAADARRRQQEMLGSKPDSGNVQEADRQDKIAEAGSTAGAMNLARQNERSYGLSAKTAVADVGRNITSNAIGAENAASNAAQVGLNGLSQANNLSRQAAGDIGSAAGAVGGIYKQITSPNTSPDSPAQSTGGYGSDSSGRGVYDNEMSPNSGNSGNSGVIDYSLFAGKKGGLLKPPRMPRNYSPGGQVVGPGTGTSDSVPVMIDGKHPGALSSSEYVLNAKATKIAGLKKLDAMNLKGLPKGSKMKGGQHLSLSRPRHQGAAHA